MKRQNQIPPVIRLAVLLIATGFLLSGCLADTGPDSHTAETSDQAVTKPDGGLDQTDSETIPLPAESTNPTGPSATSDTEQPQDDDPSGDSASSSVSDPATDTSPPTGEVFLGFLTAVSIEEPITIQIDYVELFSGSQAIQKALEDGSNLVEIDENGERFIPNDYYIRNNNPLIRSFTLADSCEILLLDYEGSSIAPHAATVNDLRQANDTWSRLVAIEILRGSIIRIEEQYLP